MSDNNTRAGISLKAVPPGWAQPAGMERPPVRRVLYLCRTPTEACMGAAGQEMPGLAVCVYEADGLLVAKWGEATVFGPIVRNAHAPRPGFIDGLVLDTLEAGDKDVFFSCVDEYIRDDIQSRAVQLGHSVRQPAPTTPGPIDDPWSLFAARRIRAKASEGCGVMSFCELDPLEHNELKVGDILYMATEPSGDGGTQVAYVDEQGWLVGMHGKLPFVLAEEHCAVLGSVAARVDYISWGRSWRSGRLRDMQFLIFEIPEEVDKMLADAKLPRGRGGGHL